MSINTKSELKGNIARFYDQLVKRRDHYKKISLDNIVKDNWYYRLLNERVIELNELIHKCNLLFDDILKKEGVYTND